MIDNNVEGIHLGGGVVHFKNALSFDFDYAVDFARKSVAEERAAMYTPGINPENGEEIYVNKSGYFFSKRSVEEMPGRASSIHRKEDDDVVKFLSFLEDSKDAYLYKYMEFFPLAVKCVWWKVKSHIVSYEKNVYLGSHSDISADYIYGVWTPTDQLATRNVISCLVYFNDSVDDPSELNGNNFTGGHHYFNYLDIDIKPKKGDILYFPSNYMAAHEVKPVIEGSRFSYLGWYSQGSPNPAVNEDVCDPNLNPEIAKKSTNVYLPTFIEDYRKHLINRGYNESSTQYAYTKSNP